MEGIKKNNCSVLDSNQKKIIEKIVKHQLEPNFYGKKQLIALVPVDFISWLELLVQKDYKVEIPNIFFKKFKKRSQFAMIAKEEISELCNMLGIQECNIVQRIKTWDKLDHFFCELCDYFFASKQVLTRHTVRYHSSEKSFKCEICEKIFGSASGLSRHIQIHDQSKLKINCDFCQAQFARNDSLLSHLRKFHKNVNDQIMSRPKRIRKTPTKLNNIPSNAVQKYPSKK